MSAINDGAVKTPTSLPAVRLNIRDFGTLIGLLLIMVAFAAVAPGFLGQRNLLNILRQCSINACVALGMTLVIISGGIDLSVGPMAALAALLSAGLMAAGFRYLSRSWPGSVSARRAARSTARSCPSAACSPSSSLWVLSALTGHWRSSRPAETRSSVCSQRSARSPTAMS